MHTHAHEWKTIPQSSHKCRSLVWLPQSNTQAIFFPPNAEATVRIIYIFLSNYRVSTKSKAPTPPGLKRLDSPGFSQWYPGIPHLTMDQKENLIDKDLSLVVVLPDGAEKMTTVHGRYS